MDAGDTAVGLLARRVDAGELPGRALVIQGGFLIVERGHWLGVRRGRRLTPA